MQLRYYLVIVIATLLGCIRAERYLSEKPPHLHPCKMTDPNFNKCMTRNFQTLFAEWKDGVPGLKGVGKLDPFKVKRVKINQDNGPLALNMDLQNILVIGASKLTVQDSKLDTKLWIYKMKLFVPKLVFDADYAVKGRVLALRLNGSGKTNFWTENGVMSLKFTLKLRDDGDVTFTEIESLECTIENIENFHVQVDNLFNGQRDLEESANALFNENWRELYEALRPAIEQTIGKVFEDRAKKIFHFVPGNYFIEDIPKANEVYG